MRNKQKYMLTMIVGLALVVAKCVRKGGLAHVENAAPRTEAAAPHPTATASGDKNVVASRPQLLDVKLPTGATSQRVQYYAMVTYFNKDYHIPNCVAYELTATQVSQCDAPGAEKRADYQFQRDGNVPGCPEWSDYKGSGYDRGHMMPANDAKWSKLAMNDCFYMTNICPQRHTLNDGLWRKLELKAHSWAKRDKDIVIITGPVLTKGMKRLDSDVAVPQGFFKVLLAPAQNRAIAFVMPNENAKGGLARYAVTVDEVERITGMDFFAALPDSIEATVESQCNYDDWQEK